MASIKAFSSGKISRFITSVAGSLVATINNDVHVADVEKVSSELKQQFVNAIKAGASIEGKGTDKAAPRIHLDKTLFSGLEFKVTIDTDRSISSKKVYGVSMTDLKSIQNAKRTGKGADIEVKGSKKEHSEKKYTGSWRKKEEGRQDNKDETLRYL